MPRPLTKAHCCVARSSLQAVVEPFPGYNIHLVNEAYGIPGGWLQASLYRCVCTQTTRCGIIKSYPCVRRSTTEGAQLVRNVLPRGSDCGTGRGGGHWRAQTIIPQRQCALRPSTCLEHISRIQAVFIQITRKVPHPSGFLWSGSCSWDLSDRQAATFMLSEALKGAFVRRARPC